MRFTFRLQCVAAIAALLSTTIQGQPADQSGTAATPSLLSQMDAKNYYYFDRIGGTLWRTCDIGTRASKDGKCVGRAVTATWPEAVLLVQELNAQNFEGADDWRLPSRRDVRNLLMNVDGIREPIGTNFYQYGFGPADLNAIYDDGKKVNYGGRYPGRGSSQCELATAFMLKTFGSTLRGSVDYGSITAYSDPMNHRWLSNNESWSNGERTAPSLNNYQNPITINFSSKCDYLVAAFFRSDKSFNLSGTLRPHAATPILLVRGGSPDRSWKEAQGSVSRESEILAQSRRNATAQMAAIVGIVQKVQGYVRDVLSHADTGTYTAASSAEGSIQGSSGISQRDGSRGIRTFICEYKCTNARFTGSDKTTLSIRVQAADQKSAEEETVRHGKATCYQQTQRVWETASQRCKPE